MDTAKEFERISAAIIKATNTITVITTKIEQSAKEMKKLAESLGVLDMDELDNRIDILEGKMAEAETDIKKQADELNLNETQEGKDWDL